MINIRLIIVIISINFCVFTTDSLGQNAKIDSLEALLELSVDDTIKVDVLNSLATLYKGSNIKMTTTYVTQAIDLSTKLNYFKGATDANRIKGLIFKVEGEYDSALYYYNVAYDLSIRHSLKSLEGRTLNNFGTIFQERGNYDSAKHVFLKALEISKQLGDQNDISTILINIGNLYNRQGDLEEGLKYYHESEQTLSKANNPRTLAIVLLNIGISYLKTFNYPRALEYFQRVVFISSDLDHKPLLGTAYTSIGEIYRYMEDHEKQIDHLLKAKKVFVELGNKKYIANTSIHIGNFYRNMGENEKALESLTESLNNFQETGDHCREIHALNSLGKVYNELDQKEKAKRHFLDALGGARTCNNLEVICEVLNELADLDRKEGNYEEAIARLNESYEIASASGIMLVETIRSLYLLHKEMGNSTIALKYFEEYTQQQDSVFSKKNTLEIARLEAKYEIDKAEREQKLQKQIREIEQERILNKANYIRNVFIIGFVALLAITFLIYKNYRSKTRDVELLNQLNSEIQKTQKKLRLKAEDLKKLNKEITHVNENLEVIVAERTKLIGERNQKIIDYLTYNSHEIRGPLARVLGLGELLQSSSIGIEEYPSVFKSLHMEAQILDKMVTNMNRELENERELPLYD